MSSSIAITPLTHWINGCFLRLLARAVIRVDGVEHAARWGHPLRNTVAAGSHQVGIGASYRRTTRVLGVQELTIKTVEEQEIALVARNGFFNHQPFRVTEEPLIFSNPDGAESRTAQAGSSVSGGGDQ